MICCDSSAIGGISRFVAEEDSLMKTDARNLVALRARDPVPGSNVIERRVLPPTCMASGREDLGNKLTNLIHAVKIDGGGYTGADLRAYFNSVVQVISDFGTESGLAKVPNVDLNKVVRDTIHKCEALAIDGVVSQQLLGGTDDDDQHLPRVASLMMDHDSIVPLGEPEPLDGSSAVTADMLRDMNRLVGHDDSALAGLHHSTFDDAQELLMPNCIYTTGFKHSMHNCNKDLNANLPKWNVWKSSYLAPVVRFLRWQPWRERLEVTCLKGTTMEGALKEFPYDILEWRWGSTHDVCECLLRVEGLRDTWDMNKYVYAADSGHTSVIAKTIHIVDRAIRSVWFWEFMRVVTFLSKAIHHFSQWSGGCPCHDAEELVVQKFIRPKRLRSMMGLEGGGDGQRCPFKGRRAAELARGEQVEQLKLIFDTNPVINQDLPLTIRNSLQDTWEIGKSVVVQSFATKVGYWQSLPYKLAVLGSLDEEVARDGMRVARELHQQSSTQPTLGAAHPWTIEFFETNPLRNEVDQFISGTPRLSLPTLCEKAGLMMGLRTDEQSIEGNMSILTDSWRSCHGAKESRLSLDLRKRHLEALFKDVQSGKLEQSLAVLTHLSSGAFQHLTVARLVGGPTCTPVFRNADHNKRHALLRDIVYRNTADVKHSSCAAVGDAMRANAIASLADTVTARKNDLMSTLMHEHFVAVGKHESFFSFESQDGDVNTRVLTPLESALTTTKHAPTPSMPGRIALDDSDITAKTSVVAVDVNAARSTSAAPSSMAAADRVRDEMMIPMELATPPMKGQTFFRVVNVNPYKFKP